MCVYICIQPAGVCIGEKGRASAIGRWREQGNLGTPDLVLVLSCEAQWKVKKREGGGGGCSTGWSDSKEKGKEDYGLGLKRSGERERGHVYTWLIHNIDLLHV